MKGKVLLVSLTLTLIAGLAAFLYLPTSSPPQLSGRDVVIEMTTKQWRFDVVAINPPGGAVVTVNPPTGGFADTTIKVRQGDIIVFKIKNLDVPHGLALEEFGINVFTPPGYTTTIRLAANKTGTFIFFCNQFCGTGHPLHKGTLIVEP